MREKCVLLSLIILLLFSSQGALIKDSAYECELTIDWNSDKAVKSLEIYLPMPENTDSQIIEMLELPEHAAENGYYTFLFKDADAAQIKIRFKVQVYTMVQEMESSGNKDIEDNCPLIDYKNLEIATKADEITQGAKNDPERVREIFNFVRELHYDYNGEKKAASWALKNKKGDCTEFTFLFIALCKASDIEARPVWGWLPGNSSKVTHLWAEFYTGEWYSVDPTEGNFHVFKPHITFNRGFKEINGEKTMEAFSHCTYSGRRPETSIKTELKLKKIPCWTEKDANYLEFFCDGSACTDALELSALPSSFPSLLFLLIFTFPFLFAYAVRKYEESR